MILDTLSAKKIPFETIDISSPENEELKQFMRQHAKPAEGQANAMPPQLFVDDEYIGVSPAAETHHWVELTHSTSLGRVNPQHVTG